MRDGLLPKERVRAIQEELAGFLLEQVISNDGALVQKGPLVPVREGL